MKTSTKKKRKLPPELWGVVLSDQYSSGIEVLRVSKSRKKLKRYIDEYYDSVTGEMVEWFSEDECSLMGKVYIGDYRVDVTLHRVETL